MASSSEYRGTPDAGQPRVEMVNPDAPVRRGSNTWQVQAPGGVANAAGSPSLHIP